MRTGPRNRLQAVAFRVVLEVVVLCALCALGASAGFAQERELDEKPPVSSATEIEPAIERVIPSIIKRPRLFPLLRNLLQKLPPFFADSQLEAHFRTYYLRKDRANGDLSEAWAIGGSLRYHSGWLADTFAVEAVGFTSQPIIAKDRRSETLLLQTVQDQINVLGIANGKLRYGDWVLTGGRQFLDLPYLNRRDNRMIPNTFESLVLRKREGDLRVSAGYTWNIKARSSDEFISMSEAAGAEGDRGFAHAGVVWNPNEDLHVGVVGGTLPDAYAGFYTEASFARDPTDELEWRLDGQLTYQRPVGDDLLHGVVDEAWNVGLRGSLSWKGAVFRLGGSVTGKDAGIVAFFGSSPSYVDLMQRGFNLADEKALLVSTSYDFSRVGWNGVTAIVNFVAGFDGKSDAGRRTGQEVDFTVDYKPQDGLLQGFWLRVRGSYLNDSAFSRDGTDVRVIVRYDFPVL